MLLMGLMGLSAVAQDAGQTWAEYLRHAGDHAALYRGRLYTTNDEEWITHPYWQDQEFHTGNVCYAGLLYPQVRMRLNIYRDELQVITPRANMVVIPDKRQVEYFEMDGMRFVQSADGHWMQQLYAGHQIQLALWRRKVDDRAVEVRGYAMKNLKVQQQFMLLDSAGQGHRVKNLGSLQKLYPQCREELKTYGKRNQLKFRGSQQQESLRQCVQFIDDRIDQSTASVPGTPVIVAPDSIFQRQWDTEVAAFGLSHVPTATQEAIGSRQDAGFAEISPEEEFELMDELTVTALNSKLKLPQTGMEKFSPQQLRNIPMSMGEADIVKMVQMMPGVSSVGEASSGFNVRGGASDQNLILMGANTLYNPMHMFALFSAVNADAVTDVELYKSGIPSRYGGRISSVMSMQNKIANMQRVSGSATVSLLTAKGQLDIPLVKNHLSLMLAGRSTYSDWILKRLPEKSGFKNGNAGFYDMNGGLAWSPNDRHLVNLSGYYSRDRFSFTQNDHYGYTNGNGGLRWKAYWRDNLTTTLQTGLDHYDYNRDDRESLPLAARLSFRINQAFLHGLVEQKMGDRHTLRWGWNGTLYNIAPGRYEPLGEESTVDLDELQHQKALEAALHAEHEYKPTDCWTLNTGLRYALLSNMTAGKKKTYTSPELRLSSSYNLSPRQQLKVAWNNMAQFIHKVSNTVIMSPTDTWTLSGSGIKPQRGWHASAGYVWESKNHAYEISAEAYYKHLRDYLTYDNSAILLMNHNLSDDMRGVTGKAYGLELQLKKNTGKLTGWISYTYARTLLQDKTRESVLCINNGRWFSADMDRPHELTVVGNYKFTHRYSFSTNLNYSSGRPTTIPTGMYYDYQRLQYLPSYSERNGYRLPYNLRLDVSFNIEPGHHLTKRTHSWFTIGCYNLTGRRNVYSLYYKSEHGHLQGYRLSIFGAPIPYVSYNIRF